MSVDHKFKPGVIVAIEKSSGGFRGYHYYVFDQVKKVHKSGNFVLEKDSDGQWRCRGRDNEAHAAGARNGRLFLYNDDTAPKIDAVNQQAKRIQRWHVALREIEKVSDYYSRLTNAAVDALEAALAELGPKK